MAVLEYCLFKKKACLGDLVSVDSCIHSSALSLLTHSVHGWAVAMKMFAFAGANWIERVKNINPLCC